MRLIVALALATIAACGNNKEHLHPEAGPDDAPPPPWWQPAPGEAKTWDIQLHGTVDTATPRAAYVVDLFSVVPAATMLRYDDGSTLPVPAGPNAGVIAALAAREDVIVCRVGVSAIRTTDPDASKFPGAAAPADDPTPPATGDLVGWKTNHPDEPDERWLDPSTFDTWNDLIFARIALAAEIGCNAVLAYPVDLSLQSTGFTAVTMAQQSAIFDAVGTSIHAEMLSAGMHTTANVPAFIDAHVADYDWVLGERCGERMECDLYRAWREAQKAVLMIDYPTDENGDPQNEDAVCSRQAMADVSDGLVKDLALTSAQRRQCVP